MGSDPVVARAGLHMWEEPCVSGDRGAGTVFFSGCPLKCVFCQNYEISTGGFGKRITVSRLREIFYELADMGAHNIDLVNPTHFTPAVLRALDGDRLPVPVIWNSGGYESPETIRLLKGKVDVFLPDMKYALEEPAVRYSAAPGYFDRAKAAITEMYRLTGDYVTDDDGLIKSGVIIRHLVLPGQLENTFRVIDWVEETFKPGQVLFSLMSQFTPTPACEKVPELNRPLSKWEHDEAICYLEDSAITDGFYQELESVGEEFIPKFDLTGI
jgi:putative pyruvate formate lyase activating enzyme